MCAYVRRKRIQWLGSCVWHFEVLCVKESRNLLRRCWKSGRALGETSPCLTGCLQVHIKIPDDVLAESNRFFPFRGFRPSV